MKDSISMELRRVLESLPEDFFGNVEIGVVTLVATLACDLVEVGLEIMTLSSASLTPATPISEVC